MEGDLPYGELALVCPDGQIVHPLDWQTERPVPLLRNVQRLTAPNPGVMTGPGTNSYLVGDPATGYIAIDPGPADADHLDKLWRAAGGDIRMIVCTHSHADHVNGLPVSTLVRRSDLLAAGGWQLRGGYEDWDLWMGLAERGRRGVHVGRPTHGYRLHGTFEPWSIGKDVSSGCIRMFPEHVIDLYQRCPIGTAVQVLPHIADRAPPADAQNG